MRQLYAIDLAQPWVGGNPAACKLDHARNGHGINAGKERGFEGF